MTQLKIAYILSIFPSVSETFIREEIEALEELGVEVTVFSLKTPKSDRIGPITTENRTIPVYYSPFFLSLPLIRTNLNSLFTHPHIIVKKVISIIFRLWRQPSELIKTLVVFPKSVFFSTIIKQIGCQQVHAHFCTIPFSAATIIGVINNIPVSTTAHGFDIFQRPSVDLRERILEAQPFITISNFNKNYLKNLFLDIPDETIKMVHCGINLKKFSQYPRHGNTKQKNILVVARLEKVKGIDILLDALAIVEKHGAAVNCNIIGDGSLKSTLIQQMHQLSLDKIVNFYGAQPHEFVINALNQADFFVLPSRSEGIPVSVMEAIASSLPVIATSVSGLPEIIEDGKNGILVPPEDAKKLAQAILSLCEHPDLIDKFSTFGYEKIQNEFDIKKNAHQLLDLWTNK